MFSEELPVEPLFDRVFVKKDEATKTKSGLHLPETVKGRAVTGTVIAVGPGMRDPEGGYITPATKVGDRVLLREYTGYVMNWGDKQWHVFQESEILGVLKSESE